MLDDELSDFKVADESLNQRSGCGYNEYPPPPTTNGTHLLNDSSSDFGRMELSPIANGLAAPKRAWAQGQWRQSEAKLAFETWQRYSTVTLWKFGRRHHGEEGQGNRRGDFRTGEPPFFGTRT